MAQINNNSNKTKLTTHEGGKALAINAEQQLRRSVMSCMLWEKTFYEDGVAIADRIIEFSDKCDIIFVLNLAVEARSQMNLRHVPLLLVDSIVKRQSKNIDVKHHIRLALSKIIQRPDEIAEFLSIYWRDGKIPIANIVKKGLSDAFNKFNEYQLAKYRGNKKDIKLRDVLKLVHPVPKDKDQSKLFKALKDDTLTTPGTWEVGLSKAHTDAEKHNVWMGLIAENKLGGLALLRNLRNMESVGVKKSVIANALIEMKTDRILPFRFIASANAVPSFEDIIEPVMLKSVESKEKLLGKTALLIDNSGSMYSKLSQKSDMEMIDAACALSILAREICEDISIFSFSERTNEIPNRRGFGLKDAIKNSCRPWATYLGQAIKDVQNHKDYDRLIVITDEQSHDTVPQPSIKKAYMINVATNKNGVGYRQWLHIDGWSEAILNYITEYEKG